MKVFKSIAMLWQQVKKYEIIRDLLVTILGVLIAFWLSGIGEHKMRNKATQQRLCLALLEAEYNAQKAKEILSNYSNINDSNDQEVKLSFNRLDSTAATAAFQDTNILLLLPLHKVSLLRGYFYDINVLNQALQVYQNALESQGYHKTLPVKELRQAVYKNAASVLAITTILQEQMEGYFNKKLFDYNEANKINEQIKSLSENIERKYWRLNN
jgi:hypothetical protein